MTVVYSLSHTRDILIPSEFAQVSGVSPSSALEIAHYDEDEMASVRKRGGSWQVLYRDPAGKQRGETFRRKVDADRFKAQVEVDMVRCEWVDPQGAKTRYGDWAAQWLAGRAHQRASTRARDDAYMRNQLLPTFEGRALGSIRQPNVVAWVADLQAKGLAPATVVKAFQLLAASLDAAVDAELIARTPCRGVPLPKVEREEMRFLSPTEIATLAETIDRRYRSLVLVDSYGGFRIGELAALKRDRVDLLRGTVDVALTVVEVKGRFVFNPPKTKAGRRKVSLPRFVVGALSEDLVSHSSEWAFPAPEGGVLRVPGFRQRIWRPAVAAAGLEGLRIHDLRHTSVALSIAAGLDPKAVSVRHGHRSVAFTLDRYGHLYEGHDEAALEALDRLGSAAAAASADVLRLR